MDKTTIAIIGGAVVVGAGALWWLSRRSGRELTVSQYTSIDRSAASGFTSPYQDSPFPTIFATLATNDATPAPPPPPPADCGPRGGPGTYYWDPNGLSPGVGSCVMVPYPDPPVTSAPPAAKKSCPWYNPKCAVKAVAGATVSGVKAGVGAAVKLEKLQADQFDKGLKYTTGKSIADYRSEGFSASNVQQGAKVVRGAA